MTMLSNIGSVCTLVFCLLCTSGYAQLAPKIEARDMDNRLVDLASLKGKVVYVDIWASWCGPCMAEFPNSIKLSQKLKNDVHFVYLNISDTDDKWRKAVAAKKLEGIHLRADEEMTEKIAETYDVKTIPRYILIDKNGKLVDSDAKRPSNVEADIRLLLGK